MACGQAFTAVRASARYCSDACRQRAHRGAALVAHTVAPATSPGPGLVERKVRADVAALITDHPVAGSLAEMSYRLAQLLDAGAGYAVAALSRELAANLHALASWDGSRREGDDDDAVF